MARKTVVTGWQVSCTGCGKIEMQVLETFGRTAKPVEVYRQAGQCDHCGSRRLFADMLWRDDRLAPA